MTTQSTKDTAPQTPYSIWLQTEVLHTLQKTISNHPGEYSFIINCQVMELYWALIVRELQTAQRSLRQDDLAGAHQALLRVVDIHEPLNATWRSLSWMTPSDLLSMLTAVGATLGRDTALQGWTYRHMVYLFGIKQKEHLEHFKPQPHRWEQLTKALSEPSLYDDVLGFLHRSGLPVPKAQFERDFALPYVPSPEVEGAWKLAYDERSEIKILGETLADIAEEFTTWKYRHLMLTRRTLGSRKAYFGVSGIEWLTPTLEEIPFPELFSARTFIGDPPAGCAMGKGKE
jgi:tryptophan 2,3-dioxygenase